MNQLPTFLVARARAAGRAVRIAEVRHRYLQEDARLLLLWQLGGEPFGIAAIRTVPLNLPASRTTDVMGDPRHRESLFRNLDQFAACFNPWYLTAPRQLVVPNRPTVALLQRLAQRLVWLHDDNGDQASVARLRMLGQILQFVTREAQRPGQALLVVLTELVNTHWVSELSSTESANLAAIDAAIDPIGSSLADAVLEAERLAIGPSPSRAEDAPVMELLATMAANRRRGGPTTDAETLQALERHYDGLFDPVERLCLRVFQREMELPCSLAAARRWESEAEDVWGPAGTASRVTSGDYFSGATSISVAKYVQTWEDAGTRLVAEEAIEDRFRQASLIAQGKALIGAVLTFYESGEMTIQTMSPLFLATGEVYFLCSRQWPIAFKVVACSGTEVVFNTVKGKVPKKLVNAYPAGGDVVLMQADPNADSSHFRLPAQAPWTHRPEHEPTSDASANIEAPEYLEEQSASDAITDDADSEPNGDRYP